MLDTGEIPELNAGSFPASCRGRWLDNRYFYLLEKRHMLETLILTQEKGIQSTGLGSHLKLPVGYKNAEIEG